MEIKRGDVTLYSGGLRRFSWLDLLLNKMEKHFQEKENEVGKKVGKTGDINISWHVVVRLSYLWSPAVAQT